MNLIDGIQVHVKLDQRLSAIVSSIPDQDLRAYIEGELTNAMEREIQRFGDSIVSDLMEGNPTTAETPVGVLNDR